MFVMILYLLFTISVASNNTFVETEENPDIDHSNQKELQSYPKFENDKYTTHFHDGNVNQSNWKKSKHHQHYPYSENLNQIMVDDFYDQRIPPVKPFTSSNESNRINDEYYVPKDKIIDYDTQTTHALARVYPSDIQLSVEENGCTYKMKKYWKSLSKTKRKMIKILTCPCVFLTILPEIIFIISYFALGEEYKKTCTNQVLDGEFKNTFTKNYCNELQIVQIVNGYFLLFILFLRIIKGFVERATKIARKDYVSPIKNKSEIYRMPNGTYVSTITQSEKHKVNPLQFSKI